MPDISVIVPVLNEAATIGAVLTSLQPWREAGHEVLVVDGGSTDATVSLAVPGCDRCVGTAPGRAAQMNAGAAAAAGRVLLFLHADTALPADARTVLETIAHAPEEAWGRFDVTLDANGFAFRVIETLMNVRSRLTGIATGDQALFVTRGLFTRVGGFPPIALMEDVALSKRLRAARRPRCLRLRAVTSARRWQQNGIARTVLTMWALRLAYFCGVAPRRLQAVYDREPNANR